ncbi:MAG: hypothetical protein AAF724_08480 [Pseudomonadota bacterium]
MSGRRNSYGMDDYKDRGRDRDDDKGHKGGRDKDDAYDKGKGKGDDKGHDVDYDIDIHAKLKGQAQLQGQGQGQGQGQHQSQSQKSYNHNSNKNTNHNESTSEAIAKVDVDLEGLQPKSDNDHIDVDVNDHAKVDTLLVSKTGDVDYNPGDDVSFEDILNGALTGAGNDTGMVFSQNGVINDDDYLKDPDVTNMGKGGFKISGDAKGGDAYADDGIDAGGGGGDGSSGKSYYKKGKKDHDAKKHMPDGGGGDGGAGGMWGSHNGDDGYVDGVSHANADGIIATEAFNQTIVQGANVLHNQVDMTVVGGNYTESLTGEDGLGSA